MEISPQESSLQNEIAKDTAIETAAMPEVPVVEMQHVIISLADGRRGVFMGPALIKEVEMKLGMVPKLVSVDFDPPRAVAIPVPRETAPVEEVPTDASEKTDNPVDAAPQTGLE